MRLGNNKYIIQPIIIIIILLLWEIFSWSNPQNNFLFSSPLNILKGLYKGFLVSDLLYDYIITYLEILTGLIVAIFFALFISFIFLSFPKIMSYIDNIILFLSLIPIFAISPLMIIWFGIGIFMKITVVFLSVFFIILYDSIYSTKYIPKELIDFFSLRESSYQIRFRRLVLPFSLDYVISNVNKYTNSAILGAIIAEFIASNNGIGAFILKSSGLYNVSYVFAGILCLISIYFLMRIKQYLLAKYKYIIINIIQPNE